MIEADRWLKDNGIMKPVVSPSKVAFLIAVLLILASIASVSGESVNITREDTFINASFFTNGTVFASSVAGIDDSAVIQSGLNVVSGDTLFFGAGNYLFNATSRVYIPAGGWNASVIVKTNGTAITGSPSANLSFKGGSLGGTGVVMFYVNKSFVTLSGLNINGNRSLLTDTYQVGIFYDATALTSGNSADNLTIRDCGFTNGQRGIYGDGTEFTGAHFGYWYNNTFNDVYNPIGAHNVPSETIISNNKLQSYSTGIFLDSVDGMITTGNILTLNTIGSGKYGIQLYDGVTGSTIQGNYINTTFDSDNWAIDGETDTALGKRPSDNNLISGNIIRDFKNGIRINGTGNTVSSNQLRGIFTQSILDLGVGNVISGNNVTSGMIMTTNTFSDSFISNTSGNYTIGGTGPVWDYVWDSLNSTSAAGTANINYEYGNGFYSFTFTPMVSQFRKGFNFGQQETGHAFTTSGAHYMLYLRNITVTSFVQLLYVNQTTATSDSIALSSTIPWQFGKTYNFQIYWNNATGDMNVLMDGVSLISGSNATYKKGYAGPTSFDGVSFFDDIAINSSVFLAQFTPSNPHIWYPHGIAFTDISSGTPTAWNWSFGDGNYSALQNPSHYWPSPAIYNVTLNASTAYAYSINSTLIEVGLANFTATPLSGLRRLTVAFTDTSTNATAWSWNFGDSSTSTQQNPSHTYNTKGLYTVNLTAYSPDDGITVTKTGYIDVGEPNVPCDNGMSNVALALTVAGFMLLGIAVIFIITKFKSVSNSRYANDSTVGDFAVVIIIIIAGGILLLLAAWISSLIAGAGVC